ncbi:SIS domain-containing protein [Kitasatospora sp. NPDC089509]|uniref:SIS domain-containing protein n=1 Tax=Kitasatospora sp. NPDC089509 TaxID=3364079 RepID=UPI003828C15B
MTITAAPSPAIGFATRFLDEIAAIAARLDTAAVERIAHRLARVRTEHGRVFLLGVGGGAGNATHAVCDLRNLAGLEAYSPTDNTATLTAAINDRGWTDAIAEWLERSRLGTRDAVVIFSVGGGSVEPPVSENLVAALRLARATGAYTCGVVGPDGGETARLADDCVKVPVEDRSLRTTHTEIYQAVVWHMLVVHPALRSTTPTWESLRP